MAKTRITIRANDNQAELYSIEERKSGDLIIFPKRNKFHETSHVPYPAIKHLKASVHISPKAAGHTITRDMDLKSGKNTRDWIFVQCENLSFRYHIYSQRFADLENLHFATNDRVGDDIVDIGGFDPRRNQIMTHLAVGASGVFSQFEFSESYNIKIIKFAKFDVCLLYTFIYVPSITEGDSADGIRNGKECEAMSEKDLQIVMAEIGVVFTDKLYDRILEIMRKQGTKITQEMATKIKFNASTVYPIPLEANTKL